MSDIFNILLMVAMTAVDVLIIVNVFVFWKLCKESKGGNKMVLEEIDTRTYKKRICELNGEIEDLHSQMYELSKKNDDVQKENNKMRRDRRLCRTMAQAVSTILGTPYEYRTREDDETIYDFVGRIVTIMSEEETK